MNSIWGCITAKSAERSAPLEGTNARGYGLRVSHPYTPVESQASPHETRGHFEVMAAEKETPTFLRKGGIQKEARSFAKDRHRIFQLVLDRLSGIRACKLSSKESKSRYNFRDLQVISGGILSKILGPDLRQNRGRGCTPLMLTLVV